MNIIFLGPAGSGKTSLCNVYGQWLKQHRQESVSFVNLDAGVDYIPFSPDLDIRNYFTLSEIMKKDKLGPNGAMLRANELLLAQKNTILKRINNLNSEFVLIDTPGQLEAFVFKEAGPVFLQQLKIKSPTIVIFILDAELTQSASNLIVGLLLALAVQIQIGIASVYILHKADLLPKNSKIVEMIQDPQYLKDRILAEHQGSMAELALIAQQAVAELSPSMRIVSTSATKEPFGLDEMHDLIHEIFCACGDLT
ncbi:MAG: ATP/GTP-binding protein [Candidatus Helarchaeota archaeon]|nr:ATP/GTP-binding protein [Candidatus Helarchaeota archaeon]